jgi:hypothetical protein
MSSAPAGCADEFIGSSITDALACMARLQKIMNNRSNAYLATGPRKITVQSAEPVYLRPVGEAG